MHPRWNRTWIALGAMLALAAGTVSAEDSAEPPAVPLDKLLSLPSSVEATAPRYGGATRSEWRARFERARAERDEAQKALDAAQAELKEIASDTGQWKMAAPGVGAVAASPEEQSLSFKLRREIRRQREEVARAEDRLQDLRVQAGLLGVPEEWTAAEESADAADPELAERR